MLLTSTHEVESAIMLAVTSDSAGVLRLLFSGQVEFGFGPSKVEQLIEVAINADSTKATKVLKDLVDLERALQSDWMGFGRLKGEHRFSYLPPVYFSSIRSNFIMNWFAERSNPPPDSDQAAAIGADAKNVLVTARAGSGKTKTLIDRATFLQQHCGVRPDEILILAFNKKAVDEVSERLSKHPGDQPWVKTFHALAHSLVKNSGKIISDSDGDAEQVRFIQKNVIDPILSDHSGREFKSAKQLMVNFFRDDWEEAIQIENLAPFDRDELLRLRNSVPYVGLDQDRYKSKGEKWIADYLFEHDFWYEYEQSIPWDGWDGSYRPDFQILGLKNQANSEKPIIIEFFGITGNKEYDEQKNKKRQLWKRHENKRRFHFEEISPKDFRSRVDLETHLDRVLSKYEIHGSKLSEEQVWKLIEIRGLSEFASAITVFIRSARKMNLDEAGFHKLRQSHRSAGDIETRFLELGAIFYTRYVQELKKQTFTDFDGLIHQAIADLDLGKIIFNTKDRSIDATKIKHILIDEFQDFSAPFYRMLEAIRRVNKSVNVFAVGDDWQAINRFAGSELRFFNDVNSYLGSTQQFQMSRNYRSSREVVDAGNAIMNGSGAPGIATVEW